MKVTPGLLEQQTNTRYTITQIVVEEFFYFIFNLPEIVVKFPSFPRFDITYLRASAVPLLKINELVILTKGEAQQFNRMQSQPPGFYTLMKDSGNSPEAAFDGLPS